MGQDVETSNTPRDPRAARPLAVQSASGGHDLDKNDLRRGVCAQSDGLNFDIIACAQLVDGHDLPVTLDSHPRLDR